MKTQVKLFSGNQIGERTLSKEAIEELQGQFNKPLDVFDNLITKVGKTVPGSAVLENESLFVTLELEENHSNLLKKEFFPVVRLDDMTVLSVTTDEPFRCPGRAYWVNPQK